MSSSSIAAIIYASSVSAPAIKGGHPDDEFTKSKAHHVPGGGFDNPWPSWKIHTVWTIVWGLIERRLRGTANKPDTTPPTVPVQKPTFLPTRESPNGKLRATWLGHACYLVEFPSGLRVLFDPVFTDRCSPFSWLGPKRYTEMPCQIKDIPFIDAVVISHNHYDHLSHPTVNEIARRHPNCQFFVPLGNKKWFTECGIHNCTELDWWEDVDLTLRPNQPTASTDKPLSSASAAGSTTASTAQQDPGMITARISCLPCQHTSARTPFDRSKTLWSSWAVTSAPASSSPTATPASVYFAGDTGYRTVPRSSSHDESADWSPPYDKLPTCPAFKDIGTRRGPFTLGLIPIGAYSPRWIMSPMHANPRDAVEIFLDTRCAHALGMHWGTWVLTEEDVLEPPKRLREALKLRGVRDSGVFDVCDIGESREI